MLKNKKSSAFFLLMALFGILLTVTGCAAIRMQKNDGVKENNCYRDCIIIAVDTEPSGTDLHCYGDSATNTLTDLLYDTLLCCDYQTGDLCPGLAEYWSVSEDKTSISFRLREGILFCDGSELTSEDVKWSFERQITKERNAQRLDGLESVDIVDRYNFVIKLRAPNVAFLVNLTCPVCGIASRNSESTGTFVPIGTGPYLIKNWDKGDAIRLIRNENHYSEVRTKEIVLKIITNEEDAINKLLSGEIDICSSVSPINYQRLIESPEVSLYTVDSSGYEYIMWNVSSGMEALRNKKVRQALSLAVNREELASVVLNGNGRTISTCIGYGMPYQKTEFLADYSKYNVQLAKQYIEEAGYSDGFSFSMKVKSNQQYQIAQLLKKDFEAVGVYMEIDYVSNSQFFECLNSGAFDAGMLTRGNATDDPSAQISYLYSGNFGSAGNRGRWKNDRFDELYECQFCETDPEQRCQYFYEMQDLVMEEQPWLCMFSSTNVCACRNGITGNRITSASHYVRDVYGFTEE